LGLQAEVAFASLWIHELHAQPARARVFRALPRFPSVKVDVALALPVALRASEAEAAIARAGQKLVERMELFDLFRGGALGEGKKSLAWHVHLRAADRTLAEKDTQRFLDRLAREAELLGGELRREAREPRTL
jgi:phenylalanyl-tRNA synthetase beta chain